MSSLRVAIDIGGTFTDVCVLDEATGILRVAKTPSTPDPIDGFMSGLTAAEVALADVTLLSHGTTVATNALITRRLPRIAMVCTRGFRDVIEIRRANKEDLWDAYKDVARPYVPRRDRLPVTERVDAAGVVVTPLDEADALNLARILRRRGVAAVAVCFMNALSTAPMSGQCGIFSSVNCPVFRSPYPLKYCRKSSNTNDSRPRSSMRFSAPWSGNMCSVSVSVCVAAAIRQTFCCCIAAAG
jgi:hypothetical protein